MLFYNPADFSASTSVADHNAGLENSIVKSSPVTSDEATSARSSLAGPHTDRLLGRDRVAEPIVKAKRARPEISHPVVSSFRQRFPHGVNWGNVAWMALMNAGAVASFWYLSWVGLAILVVMHFVTACLGVTLGYHRLLTHGSMIVPTPLKYFFSICGMLAAEGSPLFWVATHRKHHVLSDLEGDPHSPNDG
ncbi:MAG: stearoyl-CoA desaturase (delta-9 desaturase), partial [Planctomycetota bacterium]